MANKYPLIGNLEHFNKVLEAVKANGNVVKDDHNNGTRTLKLAGLGSLSASKDGFERLIPVALCDSIYFSLNPVYLDDEGIPHVGTSSVGGVVELKGLPLGEAIEKFNADVAANQWMCKPVTNVTLFE